MLIVNSKIENGYMVYNFTSNNTDYEVLTKDGKSFDVWSKRKGCSFDSQLNCYSSIDELSKRSKAFSNFASLI